MDRNRNFFRLVWGNGLHGRLCPGIVAVAVLFGLFPDSVSAKGTDTLPLSAEKVPSRRLSDYWERHPAGEAWADITRVSVPLMALSLAEAPSKASMRNLRYDFIPPEKGTVVRVDDYLQYSPAVLMVGLKACGYQGRSSWGRMLVSDAFSVAVMAATVNAVKYSAKVMRPDGSSRNSFPSGHTATAFMAATMLHKEYGQTRSLWFSVGGYAAATATGVLRMVNNRHWLSDVLMGAGLGIFSTELGYWLADLIFKEKGLKMPVRPEPEYDPLFRPSFLSLSMGGKWVPGLYACPQGTTLSFRPGAFVAVEGAYFFSPSWGLGGEVQVSDFTVERDGKASVERTDQYSARLGGYLSVPVHERIRLGGKLGAGYAYSSQDIFPGKAGASGRENAFELAAGVSFTYMAYRNFGIRLYADYAFSAFPGVSFPGGSEVGPVPGVAYGRSWPYLHSVLVGGSVSLFLGGKAFAPSGPDREKVGKREKKRR